MAMKMIVGPTRPAADRRTPERSAENASDHTAGDSADRTCDDEAGPCPGRSADPIGARVGRSDHDDGQNTYRQDEIAHPPPSLRPHRATSQTKAAQNVNITESDLTNSWQTSGAFAAGWAVPSSGNGSRQLAITWRSISPILLTPVSAMLTLSSLRMISIARATPAWPPAPSP
jgi:hypothetical protein